MKRIYWDPVRGPRAGLAAIAVLALGGLVAVEETMDAQPLPRYDARLAAAERMVDALGVLRQAREALGVPVDPLLDPGGWGLVGVDSSPITSRYGSLEAKQLSAEPAFAAAVVDMLVRAGVQEGDVVTVSASGSFPGLNLAAFLAIEALGARPVAISSAAASQFGGNIPGFTWLDMERLLHDKGLIKARSVAASPGGWLDMAENLTEEGRRILDDTIARSGVKRIESENLKQSVDARMVIYAEEAGQTPVGAHVNVGGGIAARGLARKEAFAPGLNVSYPRSAVGVDSVMTRMAARGVPVIHLSGIKILAGHYGISADPAIRYPLGQGPAFRKPAYRDGLVVGVLVGILALLGGLRWWDGRQRNALAEQDAAVSPLEAVEAKDRTGGPNEPDPLL